MQDNLELRMYGLVPYNISPIQQGIQFGHAVVEYSQKIESFKHGLLSRTEHYKSLYDSYDNWAKNWKTFINFFGYFIFCVLLEFQMYLKQFYILRCDFKFILGCKHSNETSNFDAIVELIIDIIVNIVIDCKKH